MTIPDAPLRLPDPREQPTLNLWPDTGRLLGLSRQSTYDAAHRGEIPTIRIGRRLLVPTAALARMLAFDDFLGRMTEARGVSPPSGTSSPCCSAARHE